MFRSCRRLVRQLWPAFTLVSVLSVLAVPAWAQQDAGPVVTIEPPGPIDAPEGHVVVRWQVDGPPAGLVFELEQATAASFEGAVLHQAGKDHSRFVTGLPAGENFVRVRAVMTSASRGEIRGEWSRPLVIRVDYPPLSTVFVLVAVGLVLLAATVALILIGHRRTGQEMRHA